MDENVGESRGRFFVDSLPPVDEVFELPRAEAAHAAGSRRLVEGDSVTLFDGSGWDVIAEIIDVRKGMVRVRPTTRLRVGPPLPVPVICATALPKGAREDILVSKCAELGVARLVPVEFERCVVKPSVHWDKRRARFRRLAVEAAKQSGASTVMEIADPSLLSDILVRKPAALCLVGDPWAKRSAIQAVSASWPFESLAYFVGPEGGITSEELKRSLDAGVVPVRVAASVLRIETAAISMAAIAAAFLSTQSCP